MWFLQHICGAQIRIQKRKTRKETQLKFYRIMTVLTLLYGSQTWTLGTQDLNRIKATEMCCLRFIKSCTVLDKIKKRRYLKIFQNS